MLWAKINIPASAEKQKLCQEIYQKMTNEHFFNDKDLSSINSEIFDALVINLIPKKYISQKMKSASFKRKFSKFDNKISLSKKIFKIFHFAAIDLKSKFAFVNLYFNRLIEATNYQLKEVSKKNFDFTKNDTIIIDDDQKKWHKSKFEFKNEWRRIAKNDVLTSMLADKGIR